ncbi:MAG: site-specific integrase, partial [Enterococcus sp.]
MANELVGSIEKRRDKYRLRVTVGYNELGNPIRKSKIVDAPNDRKAYNELDKWIAELEKNGYKDFSTVTFKYFYENHWKKDAVTQLEPRAYGDYRKTIEKRLLPKLGNKRLLEIKPHMI